MFRMSFPSTHMVMYFFICVFTLLFCLACAACFINKKRQKAIPYSKKIYWGYPALVFACGPLVFFLFPWFFKNSLEDLARTLEFAFGAAYLFWPLYAYFLFKWPTILSYVVIPFVFLAFFWWMLIPSRKSGIALMIACNVILGLPGYHLILSDIFF